MLVTTVLAVAISGTPFDFIRIGDIDGFGFETGTDPCGSERCWPFDSPWPYLNTDLGECSDFQLVTATGDPINIDGLGILEAGDFLPDLDCSYMGFGGVHFNSDEFDNRSPAEILPSGTQGGDNEVSGATPLTTRGSGWTDVAVCGNGLGWDHCDLVPGLTPYICGQGQPTFLFYFLVDEFDDSQPVYINAVFGDYDVNTGTDTVIIRSLTGVEMTIPITTQVNDEGEDGLVQAATAAVPTNMVFLEMFPWLTFGYLEMEFDLGNEPYLAYDFVEISRTPLVVPTGCCCYDAGDGTWVRSQKTEAQCAMLGGLYSGAGTDCEQADPIPGACCYNTGSFETCIESVDCECEILGGDFYELTPCSAIECPVQSPTGCCCYYDQIVGWWRQVDTTALRCGQLGGYYLGDDVPCDGEGSAMGACCFENDSCLETSSCDCGVLGGTFYVDVSCSYVQCGSPAPQGACCHSEAETGHTYCTVTTKTDCLNADAYFMAHWLGDWTTCSDDAATQCAEPHGACCLDTVCIWALESACLASGGHWTASVSCAEASCTSCHADVNNDGAVGITDLLDIIDGWGWCP